MDNEKTKILLIEDERSLADLLEEKLKKEGYQVDVAYDGEDGYEKIIKLKPNLILLDIVMPKMDGYEVLEKMNEEGIKIPVIIISNSGQPIEIEKTRKLGAVDCLIKAEFDPSEVLAKIKNYLNHSDSSQDSLIIESVKSSLKPTSVGIKVLLVEDEAFLREICSKKLANGGFEVYAVSNGEQALQYVEKVLPDIVLLDIILPAMDGFEVLTNIRSNSVERIKSVPVIMFSNLGQSEDVKKAMALGANNYLIKAHFTSDEIEQKIKETLGK